MRSPGDFAFKANLLFMAKCFKQAGLSQLPVSFFTMINSLAVVLMIVSREELSKIKKFISYWIEKIEVETVEETCYEYPKFLMRNTLCNLHNELSEHSECLALSNLTVREIIANVGGRH